MCAQTLDTQSLDVVALRIQLRVQMIRLQQPFYSNESNIEHCVNM